MTSDNLQNLLDKAESLGLFDANWYSQRYNLGFESKLDCFADYIRKSRHSWVDPSPMFSTKLYFRSHFSLLLNSGISPLEHFLVNNTASTAFTGSVQSWEPKGKLMPVEPFQGSLSCAITAHIFYHEYIQRLADCLHHFPISVDVFIAISNPALIEELQEILSQVNSVNNVYIRDVPNRGRNFGPLLVEFGEALLCYDLFCHVHSKKSLFSGSSQEVWGDYLFEYLLRDKQILSRALAIFENTNEYGVYFPTTYTRSLPKWASHTLKNKQQSSHLCNLLNIQQPRHGFISYPVGGMFWARSESLKPLLSHKWSYEDFPEEPIANDGTILHAMERMLVHICHCQGFKDFVYHPGSGSFTSDSRHTMEEYIGSRGDLGYIVEHSPAKVISFDIFDTLLYRVNSYPDQAKEDMAAELGFESTNEFLLLRNQAEYELRVESDFAGDVSIIDVYNKIRATSTLPSPHNHLSAEELADIELNYDISNILPKTTMLDCLHNALKSGKEVFVITDTYYTKKQIRRLLDAIGVSTSITLFVSSDLKFRKDNGTMWDHIKKYLLDRKIDPLNEYIHIGDNVVSDSQIPGDYGIGSYHILNPFEKWNYLSTFKLIESDLHERVNRIKFGPIVGLVGSDPFID
jgi:hypothetical protein